MQHRRSPKLTHHKPSGQARVRIDGRDLYLGRFGTPEAEAAYHAVIAEWRATGKAPRGRVSGTHAGRAAPHAGPTGSEVILAFWKWAECRYPDREPGRMHGDLGGVGSQRQPTTAAGHATPRKVAGLLLVAGGDPAELLEPAEGPLREAPPAADRRPGRERPPPAGAGGARPPRRRAPARPGGPHIVAASRLPATPLSLYHTKRQRGSRRSRRVRPG